MNFKQVEAFRAIILSGSMTAAAREMHTSQPNISRLIAQMERHVGFHLFERVSGRLIPTPEAEALFRDVERAFVGLDAIRKSAQGIRNQGIGHLRIAAVPSMALTIVPEVMQQFSAEYPDVRVSLHVSDSVAVTQWTASRYCDTGVSSYVPDTAGIKATLVDTFQGVCIVPPGHRLAEKRSPVTIRDFRGEHFLSLPAGDGTRRAIDALFAQSGDDARIEAYECPYAAAICMMVGRGMGVSIVNPLVAAHFMHTGIVVKPLAPQSPFPCYILTSTQAPTSQLAMHFNMLLTNALRTATRQLKPARGKRT